MRTPLFHLFVIALWACFGLATSAVAADPAATSSSAPEALYQVGPGDTLTVQVYGEPTLSGAFPVSQGGDLDVPLLGAVHVDGLTAAEVGTLLRSRLSPGYLVNPNVTVYVSTFASKPVQVLGAVQKPGVYYLHGPTNVLQILSEAGGVVREGVNEVRVTRGGDNAVVIPYDQLLAQGSDEWKLQSGDVVFVPQSLVTVMGSVGKPGEIAFREGLTVSRAIAAAGGALATANLGHVYILRGDVRTRVNVRKVLAGDAADVLVQPGDRVVVDESTF